jgi:UDP-MurNAc hydroxylase
MKVKFVNHSSFIIEHEGISIISDPWLEGRVFNNGWDLIGKTKLSYEDFKDINFIWFSHEHPDHFYPPNLKKIPLEYKKNITVLFQNTIDGRVANYCRQAGFKEVVELHKDKYYNLTDNFKVLCEYFGEGDSWICYKAGDITILNTNDCGIRDLQRANYIKNKVGKVDILLTQFSYAYWAGNIDQVEYRKRIADEKLEWMKFQCDIFEPKVTIPIASYIYFCHEENFYLNDSINTAEKTYNFLKKNTKTEPVILYNGDEYKYPKAWDSKKSIDAYKTDFDTISLHKNLLIKNVPVTIEELYQQAKIFIDNLNDTNNFIVKSVLKETSIHLHDYNKTYTLSLKHSLTERNTPYNKCDVSMSSESLLFCLKHPYGTDTTQINGRLQKPIDGNYTNFYNLFRINQQKSRGQEMTIGYLLGVGIRKILVKLKVIKV